MLFLFTHPASRAIKEPFVTGTLELQLDGLSDLDLFHDFPPVHGGIKGGSPSVHGGTKGGLDLLWPASSGAPQWQRAEHYFERRRGPIPPTNAAFVEGTFRGYEISTRGFENNDPGIDGLIFPICPVFVDLVKPDGSRIQRGHFGVHRDAGLRGSLGCIVLPAVWPPDFFSPSASAGGQKGGSDSPLVPHPFEFFNSVMSHLHSHHIGSVPLEVRYA